MLTLDLVAGAWAESVELVLDSDGCPRGATASTPPADAELSATLRQGDAVLAIVASPLPLCRRFARSALHVDRSGAIMLPSFDERPDACGHTVVREVPWSCDEDAGQSDVELETATGCDVRV